jgi:C4-dicarboxylate-specific signal transduction histidine kinase
MELAHANRVAAMGQLSASIAHEVNQPIAGAVTNAQAAVRWLAAKPPNLAEARRALDRIVQNGNRASEVVRRIHAFIRKTPPRKGPLDINEAVLEVIALTRSEIAKNDISVDTQLDKRVPHIQGDHVQLQQVLLNLIMNAIEAMTRADARGRNLRITTGQTKSNDVFVEVQDSGPGLDPVSVERIFEPFYTTRPSGLGMGLSICRSIIEAHGGSLRAATSIPQGATFTFLLPAHLSTPDEF